METDRQTQAVTIGERKNPQGAHMTLPSNNQSWPGSALRMGFMQAGVGTSVNV